MTETCQTCKHLVHQRQSYFGVNVESRDFYICRRFPREVLKALADYCGEWEQKQEEKPKDLL